MAHPLLEKNLFRLENLDPVYSEQVGFQLTALLASTLTELRRLYPDHLTSRQQVNLLTNVAILESFQQQLTDGRMPLHRSANRYLVADSLSIAIHQVVDPV